MASEVLRLKEEGNACFKAANYGQAAERYSEALRLCPDDQPEARSTLLKNLAAVWLKQGDNEAAERDASLALDAVPNDPKALFRRAHARQALAKYTDAVRDARQALQYEPNNKAIQQLLEQLICTVEKKKTELSSARLQVEQIMSCLDLNGPSEKRAKALNNLVNLSRQSSAIAQIFSQNGHSMVIDCIKAERDTDTLLAAYRCLTSIINDQEQLSKVLAILDMKSVIGLLNHEQGAVVNAAALLVQRVMNILMRGRPSDEEKVDDAIVQKNKLLLVDLIYEMKRGLTDPGVSAISRNAIIGLISKNLMHFDQGLPRGWSFGFIEKDGLRRLLTVACNIPERAVLPVNAETRHFVAICMAKLYDDLLSDPQRALYKDVVKKFVEEKVQALNDDVKVEMCSLAITMLSGPVDVAFSFISTPAYTKLLLEMADSQNPLIQNIAAEAIVCTVSKRDRCSVFLSEGYSALRRLLKSPQEIVRARALVGICKCVSSGGNDISIRPAEEEKMLRLAEKCKRLFLGTASMDVQCLAAEGLAYLALDADVKQWLVEDTNLIRNLVALAKKAGSVCAFAVSTMFVNLTNTYDKPEMTPELIKIAKYAKHHIPEAHPKDADQFVKGRIGILVREGGTSACVALSDTDSQSNRESLARVLHGFCAEPDHRGVVVQEGGAKVLLKLALNNTELGKKFAAQALARVCITINPAIALPGQRCHEVVRPLIALLHVENECVQCYEALLALTNLAAHEDSIRLSMLNANIIPPMEDFWFMQDDDLLRAAAAELYLNLLHCPDVFRRVTAPGTDRVKLWVLYCNEEDERLAKAATGAVALLTSDEQVCRRVIREVSSWRQVLKEGCARSNVELQRRSLLIVQNMVKSCYDVAAEIFGSELFEVLVAVSKLDDAERKDCVDLAGEILKEAEKYELIKATDRELYERQTGKSTVSLA